MLRILSIVAAFILVPQISAADAIIILLMSNPVQKPN